MKITIAIPCYKTGETIKTVVNELILEIKKRKENSYQIVLINDYPSDDTFDVIKEMCKIDKNIVGINLTRNFGQASAKMAAIPFCKGDVLVFMDDDGQHPVENIYRLIDKIDEGYDIVYAYFPEKEHSFFKRITSNLNSKILEINGTKPRGIHISSFYALSKTAVEAYKEYNSPFPSMGGYINTIIDKNAEVEMPHRKRISGKSNYSLKKMLKLFMSGFTNFSVVPLRFITFLGVIIAFTGFIFGAVIVFQKVFINNLSAGYTSNMAVLLLLGGLILFALGFIGEYIGRIYMTVSNLQQYRIKEVINYEEQNN